MGVLTKGRPLGWEESLPALAYVREHGVEQFINHYALKSGVTRDQVCRARPPPSLIVADCCSAGGRGECIVVAVSQRA